MCTRQNVSINIMQEYITIQDRLDFLVQRVDNGILNGKHKKGEDHNEEGGNNTSLGTADGM